MLRALLVVVVAMAAVGPARSASAAAAQPVVGAVSFFPRAEIQPFDVETGPDGALWFTNGGSIGRMTTDGVTSDFDDPAVGYPRGITTGPDGAMWFTNYGDFGSGNSIGRITTDGIITAFTDPAIQGPDGIVTGPDGALWFVNNGAHESGHTVGRITAAGVVSSFNVSTGPRSIANGPDGALWFTTTTSIGRITTAGLVTEFPVGNSPTGITLGPDGALWYTSGTTIGRITTGGSVTAFADPTISTAKEITTGPDGALWFTNWGNHSIGRITTAGVVTNFADPMVNNARGITKGPDGALWWANPESTYGIHGLGRITTTGAMSMFSGDGMNNAGILGELVVAADGTLWSTDGTTVQHITTTGLVSKIRDPRIKHTPKGLAIGPDGAVWFSNTYDHSIGRVGPGNALSFFADPGLRYPAAITSGPDGSLWFANSTQIGRITTAGVVSLFAVPGATREVTSITRGSDGALWFTFDDSVGRITTAGTVTTFTHPTMQRTSGVAAGPDGAVWFASSQSPGSIGRVTSSGSISTFETNAYPDDLVAAPDGALWFTHAATNKISRITVGGSVSSFPYDDVGLGAGSLASGSDGVLWFRPRSRPLGKIAYSGIPVAPLVMSATTGSGSLTIAWGEPAATGNSPVLSYTVTASPGGATCTWTSGPRQCTLTGLTNGTSYTTTMTVTNAFGTSAPSRVSYPFVPGQSGPPTNLAVYPGDGSLRVTWSPPTHTGGLPITGYFVTAGSSACNWTGGLFSCTVTGLTNGVAYQVHAHAVNAAGFGTSGYAGDFTPSAVPGAPTAVTATPGLREAHVAWSEPVSDGGLPISGYTITASPGGASCSWTAGPRECTISGLTAGTSYTFRAKATNLNGTGPDSTASIPVVPWSGSAFHPLQPVRYLDSRTSAGGWSAKLAAGSPRDLTVAGIGNIPPTATAAVMNITVTDASAGSYLSVWPTGSAKPSASTINFGQGQTIANLATVPIGADGQVRFANTVGTAHVIADLVGYFDDGSGSGDLYNPIAPKRLLDSRSAIGGWGTPLTAGQPREINVTGSGSTSGIPDTATTIVANVTATNPTQGSFLTVWPAGVQQPATSTINMAPGETIANLTTVLIGGNGKISVANAVGATDVIVDVVGYYDTAGGNRFHAIAPSRLLDDRSGIGLTGPFGPKQSRTLPITGRAGIPASATAVVANLTATNGTAGSFITAYPSGAVPTASNLNFGPYQTIANLSVTRISAAGTIQLYNANGSVDLIADSTGYFAPW